MLLWEDSSVIYCNEAAHIRYLSLMAKIFPAKNFYIHVRVFEDTKDQFLSILESIRENYPKTIEQIQLAKEEAKKHFSISKYTSTLDAIFSK